MSEYHFNKNRLKSSDIWDSSVDQIMERFDEINDSLNRKLEGNLYLVDNKYKIQFSFFEIKIFEKSLLFFRLTEVDILLYSYIRVLKKYSSLIKGALSIEKYTNLVDFYANLDKKYDRILKDKFNSQNRNFKENKMKSLANATNEVKR